MVAYDQAKEYKQLALVVGLLVTWWTLISWAFDIPFLPAAIYRWVVLPIACELNTLAAVRLPALVNFIYANHDKIRAAIVSYIAVLSLVAISFVLCAAAGVICMVACPFVIVIGGAILIICMVA